MKHVKKRQMWIKSASKKDILFVPASKFALNFSFKIFPFVKWNIIYGGWVFFFKITLWLYCERNLMGHKTFRKWTFKYWSFGHFKITSWGFCQQIGKIEKKNYHRQPQGWLLAQWICLYLTLWCPFVVFDPVH